ncbi:MAG: ABC transporter permease [Acidobacteriia bacterium]|nr:ABC transporter permease [Terriglobia bacterium]
METIIQDVRHGLRLLRKNPSFTLIAILTLALGIGANTAIFTVINAVFLHPLAIEDPSRVVAVFTHDTHTVQAANLNLTPSSLPNYEDFRDQNTVFSGLAAFFPTGVRWTNNGATVGLPAMMTSANYFDVLGLKPFRGRFFSADEDIKKAANVAVLSYNLWINKFGADPNLIGKTITLNNLPFTVIGVAPQGFKSTFSLVGPDWVWMPLSMRDQLLTGPLKTEMNNRRFRWINIFGRLKPGVSLAQAQSSMKIIAASLEKQFPSFNQGRTVELSGISEAAMGINQRSQFVQAGVVLMGVVGLVLLTACVTLANLLLAQSAQREREISVRTAMGASRGRLIRQLLVESITLAVLGGGVGLLVAYWGRNALWSFRPPFLQAASIDLSFDPKVLTFTAVISVLTGIIFGLAPALKLSRSNLNEILKQGGRSGSLDLGHNRMRSLLVVSEIALATVALVGSGLFIRSMQAAQNMDLGFDSKHIGFMGLNPGIQNYDQPRGEQFYLDAIAKARLVPGVRAAAVSLLAPLNLSIEWTVFSEGVQQNSDYRGSLIAFNDVTPGYFDTLRIPFRKGRDFTEFDRDPATPIAIINEEVARQLWPGKEALGKHFTIVNQTALIEVVGVVADSTIAAIGEDPTPMIYRPIQQAYVPGAALLVRTGGDPGKALGAVREQVQSLDRHMPLRNTGTVQENIEAGLWAPRMGAALLSIFGGLAMLLALIGVYGVMSYSVVQRTQEIGIRMALGANAADLLRLVIGQGMTLAMVGLSVGVVVAFSAARYISSLLFGIKASDPATYASVALLFSLVAVMACYVPARRATKVDPLVALRYE